MPSPSVKKFLKRAFLAFLAVFLLMQLIQAKRTNPPVDPAKTLQAPAPVAAILRESCYDCHSNETRWPWYAYVAPVSWWVADHVEDGRNHFNFSDWSEYTPGEQQDILANSTHLIEKDIMPLPSYLIIHRDAKLTSEQMKIISEWADAEIKKLDEPPAAEVATAP